MCFLYSATQQKNTPQKSEKLENESLSHSRRGLNFFFTQAISIESKEINSIQRTRAEITDYKDETEVLKSRCFEQV